MSFAQVLTTAKWFADTEGMNEQSTMQATPRWDLADKLRKALREVEMSSQEMAEYLEVSRHTVSNWLNGHTRPPASAVKLWAMRCGVPYEWLTSDDTPISSGRTNQPAGISAQPPTTAELRAVGGGIRKRIPLNPMIQLLRAVA